MAVTEDAMSARFLSALAAGIVLFSMFPAHAHAQSFNTAVFTTNFAFAVQNRQLPAGTYVVTRHDASFLSIRDSRGNFVATVCAVPVETGRVASATKLRFYEAEGVHMLASIFWQGRNTGQELIRPGRQAQVARQIIWQNTSTQASVQQ
jgi:hypothetical protein